MDKKNFFTNKMHDAPDFVSDVSESFAQKLPNNALSEKKPKKRLNAFDTELLEETPPVGCKNEINFLPITKLENLKAELKEVDEKIEKAVMLKEDILVRDLQIERYKIGSKIETLKEQIETSKMYHLSSKKFIAPVKNIFAGIVVMQKKIKNFFQNKFFVKFIKSVSKTQKLREVIATLNELNANVGELSTFHVPYGEEETRYKELEKYIFQANTIQTIIGKEIKRNNK